MKTKDIQVGAEYAYDRFGGNRDRRVEELTRCVVTKIEAGQVYVDCYDYEPNVKNGTDRVKPAQIKMAWAERQQIVAEAKSAKQQAITDMRADRATLERLLPASFFDDGERPDAEYDEEPGVLSYTFEARVERDGSYSTRDTLSIHDLAEIVQAAYDQGVASVKGA